MSTTVTGSAYTLKPPTYNAKLTEVGPRHADGRAAAPLLASGRASAATPARRRGR